MKGQKGITLVALIITIIVLLILAVVAITAITEDGIIDYAKKAREDYTQASDNEATIIQGYEDVLKNWNSSSGITSNNEMYDNSIYNNTIYDNSMSNTYYNDYNTAYGNNAW